MTHRTLYQKANTWPIYDSADPLNGWSPKDVEDTSSGPATADIYGKLFYHLRALLRTFILNLSKLAVSFRLFHLAFSDLQSHLERNYFSRIEVGPCYWSTTPSHNLLREMLIRAHRSPMSQTVDTSEYITPLA